MALGNTANVIAGIPDVVGGIWVHDLIEDPAELPNETTVLADAGFVPVGFISEDGLSETSERDTDKIKAWGGDTVRVIQNEHSLTYTFTFLELKNLRVLRLIFGDDNVYTNGDGSIGVKKNSKVLPHKTWAFEILDNENKIRLVVPDGQITETGDRTFVHSDVISMEVTLEAFTDKDGNKGYEFYSTIKAGEADSKATNPVDSGFTPVEDSNGSEAPSGGATGGATPGER